MAEQPGAAVAADAVVRDAVAEVPERVDPAVAASGDEAAYGSVGSMAAQQPTTGLRLTGLGKVLGGRSIVEDLDLDVAPGELVCLLGPSGCGKTTTLRMIAGFLTPDSGRILVGDADVTTLPPERRPSAMVFQNYALWPHMTVEKNVAYPLKLAKVPKDEAARRVTEALELVNMTHHRGTRPARISGGEQQRTALARALVQRPKVLLLDEPLSNLDAKLRVRVREDIREIQQRLGITTVMVTHDQEEAMAMSDRIAVMNAGRIEQVSTPAELYANPQTEFVASFVGHINRFEGRFAGGVVEAADVITAVRPEDVVLVGEGTDGAVAGVVTRSIPHGHFTELTLETAYGVSLRSYVGDGSVCVGDRVWFTVRRSWEFKDGRRVVS